jgi:hypothetical protein
MVAFAMHLLRTVSGLCAVSIHPDGEHGKCFELSPTGEIRDLNCPELGFPVSARKTTACARPPCALPPAAAVVS